MTDAILTLNAGSSSLKTALYAVGATPEPLVKAHAEGIGGAPRLKAWTSDGAAVTDESLEHCAGHAEALVRIIAVMTAAVPALRVAAVGHRIVHGGPDFFEPARLDDAALSRLEGYTAFAPLHQPHNLAGVRAARAAFPAATQVGCFDTAFHRAHPWESDVFALPRSLHARGVRRYGFHGLSYEYVSGRLREIDPQRAAGRVVIAHLGAGASMCAVRDGRSIDSTMGFTALDGLPMATRCGQIDPGVLLWLLECEGLDTAALSDLLYRESGLKGLSGLTGDMRALAASDDPAAAEALRYYAHRARREIGALTATLGGLDALVFCGGVGENASGMREMICGGLGWLGATLDASRNEGGEGLISTDDSTVAIRVIPTDEEAVIAGAALRLA